ncbi:hypothetical protein NKH18_04220 [Streptomyces sp. M10(2022)]
MRSCVAWTNSCGDGCTGRPRGPRSRPRPGRRYSELVGGPLDGLLLDVTGWTRAALGEGAALDTEIGAFGPGGRSAYGPREADPDKWDWQGDMP